MITITALIVTFIAIVIATSIVVLRTAIAREENDNSLLGKPATRTAAVTRRLVDFSTELPQR